MLRRKVETINQYLVSCGSSDYVRVSLSNTYSWSPLKEIGNVSVRIPISKQQKWLQWKDTGWLTDLPEGLESQNQRPSLVSQEQWPKTCPFGLVSTRLPLSTTCCSLHRQLYETWDVAALGLDIATVATSKGKNHIGGTWQIQIKCWVSR